MIRMWWYAALKWLANVPVADPVDRRNAPAMQVLFILIGCVMPVATIYYFRIAHFKYANGQEIVDFCTNTLVAVVAWACLALTRHGRFRASVTLLLSAFLLLLATSFLFVGLRAQMFDPLIPTLSLVIAGLVLGRLALWSTIGILYLAFLLGAFSSYFGWLASGAPLPQAFAYLPPISLGYLMMTVVIDRTTSAYRESLIEANENSRLLRLANEYLSKEMDERAQAQQRLIHAQKLETVGRVASGVAHDFDNVLGVIMGYAQRREQLSYGGIDALAQALEGIELAARRGKAVSRRMLSFSRHEVTKMEVFDVVAELRELMPMVRQMFAANVNVELRARDEPLPVSFDIAQFELVVLNIAANARDAMPEGGRFVIEAHRNSAGDQIEIALIDSGHGISDGVKAHIFDAFYTTKPTGQGTGLGLVMVKDLVMHAGGSIDVESAPGHGACFRIRLPYVAPRQPARPSE